MGWTGGISSRRSRCQLTDLNNRAPENATPAMTAPAQRRALALCGDEAWCRESLARLAAAWHDVDIVQVPGPDRFVLGGEIDVLVVDGFAGFDPDAFGRAVGAVRGGGLVVFLTPPFADWCEREDPQTGRMQVALFPPLTTGGRFVARLARILNAGDDLCIVRPGDRMPAVVPAPRGRVGAGGSAAATPEQARAVAAVVHVVTGHRRRPLVLTADRGRGKSAAFGLAAAELLRTRCTRILVTAPQPGSVDALFEHAVRALPDAARVRGSLIWRDRELRFVPPDQLLAEAPDADLLLVDEAAAIPTAMLHRLLQRYSRIAFATTVHGYEGTGRGFAVRFNRVLDRETPDWIGLSLHTPVRWPENDPVERLAFRLLLLDAAPAVDEAVCEAMPGQCRVERVDRDALAADERLLSEVFGLLVLAHYRTRPFDLRYLLDGPNIAVYVMRYRDDVVATAWVAREGGFGEDVLESIFLGASRPHGHLLPEALSTHLGLIEAPALRCARVLRIAVHPAVQRRGLGGALARTLIAQARGDGVDYAGTSFGATPELLRFWSALDFVPVRLGLRHGTASGEHSVLMLRGLSKAGGALIAAARERFVRQFPAQLTDALADVEPALVRALWRLTEPAATPPLDAADWRDLDAFARGGRQYETCIAPLRALALAALAREDVELDEQETAVVIGRVLQARSWAHAAHVAGLTGRAQALEVMRRVARRWLQCWHAV